MALDFDGERMVNNKDRNSSSAHPKRPLCACTAYSCNKLILFLLACIYVIVGAGLLIVGVWVTFQARDYEAVNHDLLLPALMMIGVGFLITTISLFGVAGVVRENNCLLIFYLVLTILAFLLQVGIGVLAFIHRQKVPDLGSEDFMYILSGYHDDGMYRRSMDNLQAGFQCCGFDSYSDYEQNRQFDCGALGEQRCGVPWSCCKNLSQNKFRVDCGYKVRFNSSMPIGKVHTVGCTELYLSWLSWSLDFVGIIALGTCIPQIISILLAYFLIRQVREMKMWYRVEM
ncbi:tetraspanin-15-like [Mya arenaria]|uniref:tetraspanin-15-like n=1 Tax=Mya arenaria TaxID=6604 RepID=UPI0022E71232|nr:tetraspanin-15-like [Mya arenaria]